jgi:hypothetical protein
VTLDGLLADKGPRRPALVKIDVQGAEMLTLQGMTEILRFARPALFIELSDQGLNKFGASVLVVLRLLSDNGYEAYWLTRTGHRKASQSEIEARTALTKSADVLFLKTGPRTSASQNQQRLELNAVRQPLSGNRLPGCEASSSFSVVWNPASFQMRGTSVETLR